MRDDVTVGYPTDNLINRQLPNTVVNSADVKFIVNGGWYQVVAECK